MDDMLCLNICFCQRIIEQDDAAPDSRIPKTAADIIQRIFQPLGVSDKKT